MEEHFRAFSAVFPMIFKAGRDETKILLHRRKNTGYQDGKWDIAASGYVDKGETAQMAVIRECKEELGIDVKMADIEFAHLSHHFSPDRTYYDIYFLIKGYNGDPSIMEPDKCSELSWFSIEALPDDIIECRKLAIECYINKKLYSEIMER